MTLVYALVIIGAGTLGDARVPALSTIYFATKDFCEAAKKEIRAASANRLDLVCVPTGGVGQ